MPVKLQPTLPGKEPTTLVRKIYLAGRPRDTVGLTGPRDIAVIITNSNDSARDHRTVRPTRTRLIRFSTVSEG